jgi:hypothetical protein
MKPEHVNSSFNQSVSLHFMLLLHAFSIAIFILVCNFLPLSFELKTIKNLIVSQATINGVDIGLRVAITYRFIFGGIALAAVFYFLFRYLQTKTSFDFLRHQELILFSATIICLSFLQIIGVQTITVLKLLFTLFCLRLGMLLPFRSLVLFVGVLRGKTVFTLCISFAFLMLLGVLFLIGYHGWVREGVVWIYLFFILVCFAVNKVLHHYGLKTSKQFLMALLPFTSVPLLTFLFLELMLFIRHVYGYTINYKLYFIATILGLYLLLWFLRKRKVVVDYSIEKLIRKWLAPSLLFVFVILAFYQPLLQQQTEMFESANTANSVMNVFRFGKIPMLDFASAHMLCEQWFGYLYALIFGWSGHPDFVVYDFLNTLLVYFVLYALLNKLFHRPFLSIFFIVSFPFIRDVFYPHIFIAVLPLFLSKRLLERPSSRNFLNLFLLLLALILWKIDAGAAGVFASLFYVPILWFVASKKFPLNNFFKGMLLFAVICFIGIGLAMLLRSPQSIWTSIQMALHLFSASQAHGYYQLTNNPTQQFYIYHVLFPFTAIVLCIYIVILLKKNYKNLLWKESFLLLSSLFLFLLFLGNLQRGLVRHGFAEQGETIVSSTFFAALALLIVHWCKTGVAIHRVIIFYGSTFLLFVSLKFFPYNSDGLSLENALLNNAFKTDYPNLDWQYYQGRTLVDTAFARENYGDLKLFLDRELSSEQTFLDFSNTPILYYFCERKVLGYFTQNMQNTVDDYLQLQMLKEADTSKVPIAVFANYPRNFFDATDDVPNILRYYLVAEHIFDQYQPYRVIGNKSIWVSKSFHALPAANITDTLITQVDATQFNLLPEYIGLFYNNTSGNLENKKDLKTVLLKTRKDFMLQNDSLFLQLDYNILTLKHCYLSIEFEKRPQYFEPFQMEARFADTSKNTVGIFTFTRSDRVSSNYMFRLSNHYFWHCYGALQLSIPHAGEIKRISILKDMRFKD